MRGGEFGGEHHVAMGVDGAQLPQPAGLGWLAVSQLTTAAIKGQQSHAVSVGGADEAAIRAEAQLLDVASAHIGFLDVVGESQRTARGHGRPRRRPLLELVHACPLQKGKARGG